MNKAGGKSQTAQANILGGRNPAFPRDHILALHCATVVSFKPFLPNVAYTQEEPNVYTSELGRNGLREISLSLSFFHPLEQDILCSISPFPNWMLLQSKANGRGSFCLPRTTLWEKERVPTVRAGSSAQIRPGWQGGYCHQVVCPGGPQGGLGGSAPRQWLRPNACTSLNHTGM